VSICWLPFTALGKMLSTTAKIKKELLIFINSIELNEKFAVAANFMQSEDNV
jgi:hypothetical protein